MYDELDALPEPEPPAVTLKIDALTAAVMERIAERQSLTDQALVAALEAIGTRESVVNVHPVVEPTPVTVEAPHVTVEAPHITVEAPAVNVPAAQITVQPANVMLPERSKTVTFERDPLTQQVTKAEVVET
jgi:phage baseplate assembly protein gpV